MQNDYFTTRPIVLGNNTVECVTTYKLLGIIITNDLKWNEQKKLRNACIPWGFLKKRLLIEEEFTKFTWQQEDLY